MKKKLIAGAVLLSVWAAGSRAWAGAYGIEEKIALETALSQRIEAVVTRLLGDTNVIVLTNVDYDPTIEQEIKTAKASAKDLMAQKKDNVLPGIPMDAVGGKETGIAEASGGFSQTIRLPQFVKSIGITVIVSDTIPEIVLSNIQEQVGALVDLDPRRGDRLEIKRMTFAEDRSGEKKYFRNMAMAHLPWFYGLLVLTFFVFGPLRSFMRNMVQAIEIFKIQADTRIVSKADLGTRKEGLPGAPEMPLLALPGTNDGKEPGVRHFDFVNGGNIGSLLYLLKSEAPETIAIVMTYLPKEYSGIILEALPDELKIETLRHMSVIRQYKGDDVRAIEEKLKERVNYLLGGPQNIVELISVYGEEMREKILSDIRQQDPVIVEEIRKLLITVENLKSLAKEHLYEVYKAVGTRLFAGALIGVGGEIQGYVMGNLTEGARDMLKQEMDLIRNTIPRSRVDQAKKDVIAAMRALEAQGVIKIPR